jgi:uncharacterized protein HemY
VVVVVVVVVVMVVVVVVVVVTTTTTTSFVWYHFRSRYKQDPVVSQRQARTEQPVGLKPRTVGQRRARPARRDV